MYEERERKGEKMAGMASISHDKKRENPLTTPLWDYQYSINNILIMETYQYNVNSRGRGEPYRYKLNSFLVTKKPPT